MPILLDSPRLFVNLCVVARTLEVFGFRECYVNDTHRLIRPRYGKSRTRVAKSNSAGAFARIQFTAVEDPEELLRAYSGRVVGAVPSRAATPLFEFRFRSTDIVVFGSERDGIGEEILPLLQERVTIPQRGITESLNLGVSVGIVLYEMSRQMGDEFSIAPDYLAALQGAGSTDSSGRGPLNLGSLEAT